MANSDQRFFQSFCHERKTSHLKKQETWHAKTRITHNPRNEIDTRRAYPPLFLSILISPHLSSSLLIFPQSPFRRTLLISPHLFSSLPIPFPLLSNLYHFDSIRHSPLCPPDCLNTILCDLQLSNTSWTPQNTRCSPHNIFWTTQNISWTPHNILELLRTRPKHIKTRVKPKQVSRPHKYGYRRGFET